MKDTVWIIFNGPSNRQWISHRFKGPVFGCNYAYRDFPVTDLFVADRMCVHSVRKDPLRPDGIHCYTKQSPLELPPGWRQKPTPGIDSGSFALEQAFVRYPKHQHIIIGADGILLQNHESVYEYQFRNGMSPREIPHKRHRKTVLELLELYQPNYAFVSDEQDPEIKTITYDTFRKQNMVLA